MNYCRFLPAALVLLLVPPSIPPRAVADEIPQEQADFFESRVRPLLASECFACHGEKRQENGLRLDSREAILRGGDSGVPAAAAGEPNSLILRAVRHQNDLEMPPEKKLNEAQISDLAKWIELGLPWPSDSTPVSDEQRYDQIRANHWSLQPVVRPPLPAVPDPSWVATPIDMMIAANLASQGLSPSPQADSRTLLRRLTFDLLGLPPSWDDVQAFEEAARENPQDAYRRLVDRLLASPAYGERWGRHWLDVVRYADTKGYAFGKERRYPYAYTYRDYVIAALNADLPYDEFVRQQIAADRYLQDDQQALAGLGLLTVGRKFSNRHLDIDDQIDVVTRGFLGLTVACARCHDHKYDAIPTDDYYSLYGIFASSHEPADLPLIGVPTDRTQYQQFQEQLARHRQNYDAFRNSKYTEIIEVARSRVTEYLVRVVSNEPEELLQKLPFISLSPDELRPPIVNRWRDYLARRAKPDDRVFGLWHDLLNLPEDSFAAAAAERLAGAANESHHPLVLAALTEPPLAAKTDVAQRYGNLLSQTYMLWKEKGANDAARATLTGDQQELLAVLLDGDSPTSVSRDQLDGLLNRADRNKQSQLQKQIDSVQVNHPGAPPRAMIVREDENPHNPRVFLRGNHARPGKAVPRQFLYVIAGQDRQPYETGGRLELANAITDPGNPLTRRVIVNRLWMHHFGQPLVDTPSDFGVRCPPPQQQAVLDYLAWRLLDCEWSLKQVQREIVLSSTYRQASVDRPDCRERDPENRLYWKMNRRRLEFEVLRDSVLAVADQLNQAMGGRPIDLLGKPEIRRRSVYALIDRQDLPNLLRVFDFPSPDQSQDRRPETTVPQQSLFLMNSPFLQLRSQSLLERIRDVGVDRERIGQLYRLVLQRLPSDAELEVGLGFVENYKEADPWLAYAQLLLMTNEFAYVD